MPYYDYRCVACGRTFETSHSMEDKPKVPCPACKSEDTKKMPSLCGIVVRKNSSVARKMNDKFRREGAMRMELKQDYGLHTVSPLAGRGLPEVYNDIRSRGAFVKEEMTKAAEEGAAKQKAKQREWKRKAQKRAPERGREMERRQAAEAAAKRRIVI